MTKWYDYDERFKVLVSRNPDLYNNLPYKKLIPTKNETCRYQEFLNVIYNLLQAHSKSINEISHVVYVTEEGEQYQCTFQDLLAYLPYSSMQDILQKDIVIKGNTDWWICYESRGVWDFFLVERPVSV